MATTINITIAMTINTMPIINDVSTLLPLGITDAVGVGVVNDVENVDTAVDIGNVDTAVDIGNVDTAVDDETRQDKNTEQHYFITCYINQTV